MLKQLETAQDFIKLIPRTIQENIKFRLKLHKLLSKDKGFQKTYWKWCREDLQVLFDTSFWTMNPRKPWGHQNQPFILRPQQIPAVHKINNNLIKSQTSIEPCDVGINKTRDEGASEICAKIFAAWVMLYKNVSFILGSDKKEDVDNIGNDYTLFAKVDNVFNHLPSWMNMKWENQGGPVKRKDMLLRVKTNESAIIGETTNENFSAGSRATAMVLDEFGRIRKSVADSIEGTVHAVTNCVIYSSTHWLGRNHTFNQCLNKETTDVVELLWHQNPEKAEGLYRTPEPGIITIDDIEYYRKKCDFFNDVEAGEKIRYDAELKKYLARKDIKFVANGNKDKVVICRSPWHDYKQAQSKGNKRDFYCNVWATPLGAADSVFDSSVLYEMKERFCRPPAYRGEVLFELVNKERVDNVKFVENLGQSRLMWWGPLVNGRPDQRHNYILGADPGQGLGSSNSVAMIYDVNTHELVGEWACSNTKPEAFADQCVALCEWVGGVDPCFFIWERNGGHGTTFTERIMFLGYFYSYKQTVEDTVTRKRKDKYGFHSNTDRKAALFAEFGVAIGYAIEDNRRYVAVYIYSDELIDELFDYMFTGEGKQITTSEKADLSTGARERHGDRGIAAGLCILGTKDQIPGDYRKARKPPVGSFEYHRRVREREIKQENRLKKKYLF
jgi:hypothetical protein